jgi:2-polyprenyl-3-methyl-5-hydroxy-6-metoxy-1,4-benzoquinol methylase
MDYVEINRKLWDSRVPHHYSSEFYDVPAFVAGANSLTEIELPLLGDVSGKRVLHLQCHFGQDTLSLSRMGAIATGLDFSEVAIEKARMLVSQTGLHAEFIQSDVYEADKHISAPADIVFTTYGVVGWLPDLNRWAQVISRCLKPGGELVFAEFHPAVWMFDNDFTYVQYSYFMQEPIVEEEQGTYADNDAPLSLKSVGWNHSIGEVFTALRNAGLQVTFFQEYDFSPYPFIKDSVVAGNRRWHIKGMEAKLPLVYAIKAVKE